MATLADIAEGKAAHCTACGKIISLRRYDRLRKHLNKDKRQCYGQPRETTGSGE